MTTLSLILLPLLLLAQYTAGYVITPYGTSAGHSSSYTSSLTSSSSSSSKYGSDSNAYTNCCQLNQWAYEHMEEVRQLANRLRQEYNNMSQGSSTTYHTGYLTPWRTNIIELTGKTAYELDSITRRLSEQLITDMRKGVITYQQIAQPGFFEWKAATTLQQYDSLTTMGQLQQQRPLQDYLNFQPSDLSNFDEIKNYAYPAEVKIIDGKTYIVHKNCTEAKKTIGEGTYESPLVTVVQRNRTTMSTSNARPTYVTGDGFASGSLINAGVSTYPGAYSPSSTTVTRKKTIYDFINHDVEPTVLDYNPIVTLDHSDWSANLNSYKPPVHIPVDADVETISTAGSYGNVYPGSIVISPSGGGSTVTIKRVNKTIITNSDGTNTVSGSEVNKKWVDGKLVYDTERPFGEWSVPRDEAWKREERERFFWFLTQGATSANNLVAWQRQQEERIQALAQRYQTSVDVINEWHRRELQRYHELLHQYQAQSNDLTGWQRLERGRLDWLIHQNSVTREELERWQRENENRLAQLARQYRISLQELKAWQIEELNRLYVYFNEQNNSMLQRPVSDSLRLAEEARLNELIRQHNLTIAQLQESIASDRQKLLELSKTYQGNVQDMEAWLKAELARLHGVISNQQQEMTRITEWQHSERARLENIVKQHRGSVGELEEQMQRDRAYIQALATKYKVSIEELERWQRTELERLHNQGQSQLTFNITEWQQRERDHLKSIINKNDLTIEEFQQKIINDRARLEELAKTYKIQVSEVEEWIRNEIKNFQSQGLLKEVEKELAQWQQQERERLLAIVRQNELTVEELEQRIKNDQTHLKVLANTYQVQVTEIEEWLRKELLRLQGEGLIKVEDLKEWQKNERAEMMKLVQENKLTIEEFEKKLLTDRQRLQELASTYNVQTSEIEAWIKKEGERLQSLGLLQMQEQLNNWQKIERERLLWLIKQNNLSIEELEQKIKNDQVHLYSLARQHQVRVEEIEEWIKKEIKKLQQEGVLEMEKLKDWQTEWRGNLTNLVKERDFTVEEFHKWLLEDRARLQALAMQHNVEIEEIEQWVRNEEQNFLSMGLLKPNEKLTNWQQVERNYLERIAQERFHSTEQLEQRLRQDREMLEQMARQYSIQVEEIERWMKKELARLRDDGRLQIENLSAWQIAERERLEQLIKQQKQYSVEEFEALLRKDREHMQKLAFQYHTSVEEIEKWVSAEVERLRQQGKLDIESLTAWQKAEQQRIFNLLQQQSSITLEEFERKVQNDRDFLLQLAQQHRVNVGEVEVYIKKVIEDLRAKGKFELENLQTWQKVERDYIKQLIAQYNNGLSTKEYEEKLLNDRVHLQQLADQYRINQAQIEQWMIEELKRLRQGSENNLQKLNAWQQAEIQRIKDLIRQNGQLSYVEYEVELMKERARLQDLARQYSLNVEQIENWLRQQLVNLKTTGDVQVESLTLWQEAEQKRLIDMLLQQQHQISFEEFELQLQRDRARLQQLAQQYSVTVEQIERYMREELQRLQNSGLLQVEELTTWQTIERDNLRDWLRQHNNAATTEQFNEFLRRDRARIQQIAQEYHVTVEEVESWVREEGARLRLLGYIRPESLIYVDDRRDDLWKDQTRVHLQAIAQVRPMTWQDFERYLKEERVRWEQFARQYNITVEEIEFWLRDVAKQLVQQGLIQETVTVEKWQVDEQIYIQNLINERLAKQQQWSIEELERMLIQDRQHLQALALKYKLAIEEIERWYKQELQRLLNQRKLISEHLVDWQRREKERIYWIVVGRPSMSVTTLTEILLNDRNTLNRLADEYHVTMEELEYWIRNEIRRLLELGLISDSQIKTRDWKQEENVRLRAIAAEISITQEELLEYIENDNSFQNQLANLYGCALSELAPTQHIIIKNMQTEGELDSTKLLRLEQWQKRERDRLYSLIKSQNFSLKNLKDWQRQDIFLNELAAKYGITVETLKSWQLKEYERLQQLAAYYQMSLNELQDFRQKELLWISHVMHKKVSNEAERIRWGNIEAKRMAILQEKTGLSGVQLLEWRRRLYLLCQGLIPMDFGHGGHEIGRGSTNVTHPPEQIISKDRGDQPPHIYDESLNGEEPGLEGEDPIYPQPTPAPIRVSTTTQRPQPRPQPQPQPQPGYLPSYSTSGMRYTKKEYTYTVPVIAGASANAAGSSSSAASANIAYGVPTRYGKNYGGMNGLDKRDLPEGSKDSGENQQQQKQQQQEVQDLGQQQQIDISWNGQLQQGEQQQLQVNGDNRAGSYTNRNRNNQQQQQEHQEVEDFGQQQQVELSWNGQLQDGGQQQLQVDGSHRAGSYVSRNENNQQQVHREVEDFGQQQQVELSWNGQLQDGGQQQVQVDETWNRGETSGSYTNRHGSNLHNQQQQQEDFGQQQQLELAEFNQQDLGQQQVQVEDLRGIQQSTVNQKQIATSDSQTPQQVEVKAEQEPTGFFGRLKSKIFG